MPLLDHFHPPLSDTRHWESFHARWAAAIADALNQDLLPEGYYAEEQVHFGGRIEIDVATFESLPEPTDGGVATARARVWAPPAPDFVIPAIFPDSVEVLVFSGEAGPTLVAAVELISPGNKDRDQARQAFCIKCASYLHRGIGLIVVDTVTSRQANLHNDLMGLLAKGPEAQMPPEPLYAAAYRPVRRAGAEEIEGWTRTLRVGQTLPVMALALDQDVVLPLDLESTYSDARSRRRMPG